MKLVRAKNSRGKRCSGRIKRPTHSTKSGHGYTVRNLNLKALGFNSYDHYLNSDIWQEVKRLAFAEHGTTCFRCGCDATQIHHSSYDLKTLVGSDLRYLHPVCRPCHEAAEVSPEGKEHFCDANRNLGLETRRLTGRDKWMAERLLNNKGIKKKKRLQ